MSFNKTRAKKQLLQSLLVSGLTIAFTASNAFAATTINNNVSTGALTATANSGILSADFGGGYGSTGVTISSAGNVQANGTLTVDGTWTLTGAGTITGALTMNGGLSADGGVFTVADTTGAVHTGSTLDVDGTSDLGGDITFSAATPNLAITNTETLTVTDGTNTLMTLVDGGTTGNLTASGNITATSGVYSAAGAFDMTGAGVLHIGETFATSVTITPATTFTNAINPNGGVSADSGAFTVADTTGAVHTGSTLDVVGNSTLASADIGGGYGSTGATIASQGNITTNGTLTVDSTASIGDTITLADATNPTIKTGTDGQSILIQDASANNLVTINDAGTAGNVNVSGSFTMNGKFVFGRQTLTMVTGGVAQEALNASSSYVEVTGQDQATDSILVNDGGVTEGTVVYITNLDATNVVIEVGAHVKLSGGANVTLTQYDVIGLIFNGTDWLQISSVTANS